MGIARDCGVAVGAVPRGIAPTEVFDVLDLKRPGKTGGLAAEFYAKMAGWQVLGDHKAVIGWAPGTASPTNPGESCQSGCELGRIGSDQRVLV